MQRYLLTTNAAAIIKTMNQRKIFHNGHYVSANIDQSLKVVRNSKYGEIKCDDEDAIDYHYETADIFLHGSCQLFSLALHRSFGYNAYKITWEGRHIHYFCMIDLGKHKIYIDVRGIVNNGSYFIESDGLSGDTLKHALEVAKDVRNSQESLNTDFIQRIEFTYKLKNGTSISRTYKISVTDFPKSLIELSKTEDFKDDQCMLYHFDTNNFSSISIYSDMGDINIDKELGIKILETYLKEYDELTILDYFNNPIECEIIGKISDNEHYDDAWFSVYSSFEETIALLREAGYVPFQENDKITIKQLELYDYDEVDHEVAVTDEDYRGTVITDEEYLAKLKPYIKLANYNYHLKDENFIYGNIYVDSPYGQVYYEIIISHEDYVLYF